MDDDVKKDKKLYCYKQALSQPYWVQKLNDTFSFSEPIRFSLFVYGAVLGIILWTFLSTFFSFIPIAPRGIASICFGLWFGQILSEMVIDGKDFIHYLIDYLLFYINYGLKADKQYINKGMVYQKYKKKGK
ncbi:TcpE family conjugal transfer membrane protein [Streptococcus suis]|uniref:TcpE family conjugal transfer membrane protein n=1 Tax=Streptococcus suis TaxID=1307 RepID=UPI002410B655|nr:TcpE family conjugal transfer membrane protein [Streptococcus suis]MDG3136929.1 conjugal transfer protein [Streptococcus suis]HEM3629026.1 conjugal transfer protein [Streptococcus suis]